MEPYCYTSVELLTMSWRRFYYVTTFETALKDAFELMQEGKIDSNSLRGTLIKHRIAEKCRKRLKESISQCNPKKQL